MEDPVTVGTARDIDLKFPGNGLNNTGNGNDPNCAKVTIVRGDPISSLTSGHSAYTDSII
tara:strand:+ start:300 stop:479 length:180 start_codon:yes stop_codon:yes gene_type:complete